MRDEQIKKLKVIKDKIKEGDYSIFRQNVWDSIASDLSNCGATLLEDIERHRDEARRINLGYLFNFKFSKLDKLNSNYNEISRNYDIFFDASMRWIKSIIENNKYEEHQRLKKKYVEKLLDHCSQSVDNLGSIVSSKHNDYRYYQALSLSVIAIIIALISLVIRLT